MYIQNSSKEYFISFLEWEYIQNIKKEKKIAEFENFLAIQNSNEYNIFNSILNKLISINIFDLSRISYLVILFLSPYIDFYMKKILYYDEDIPTIIIDRIFSSELQNYQSSLDKTIGTIINIVLNQLNSIELFLNIQIFILYLNLYSRITSTELSKNIILFKISQLAITIIKNIPKSELSLFKMKIINKLGNIQQHYFNDDILTNLNKEDIDSKIIEIIDISNKTNDYLDDFIIQIIKLCDLQYNESNADSSNISFIPIWNLCKDHIIKIIQNSIQLFKINLDILIIHLVNRNPEIKSNLCSISNSIINLLEIEILQINNKLSI